jgi:hypothetical protein
MCTLLLLKLPAAPSHDRTLLLLPPAAAAGTEAAAAATPAAAAEADPAEASAAECTWPYAPVISNWWLKRATSAGSSKCNVSSSKSNLLMSVVFML